MGISELLFHTNCRTVIIKGEALLNLRILATGNTKGRSKQGRNDGDTWKMFLGRAAAALRIIQRDSTIFRTLTFISLTTKIFKALSEYAMII